MNKAQKREAVKRQRGLSFGNVSDHKKEELKAKTWSPYDILADPDPLNLIEDLEEAGALPEFLVEPLAAYHTDLKKVGEDRDNGWHALLEENLDRCEYQRRFQELEQTYSDAITAAMKRLLLRVEDSQENP